MDTPLASSPDITTASKRLTRRLLTIGENRLELLFVELQEERQRLIRAVILALGVAAFGLLAGVALTVAVLVGFWEHHPLAALLVMVLLYGAAAGFLYVRLMRLLQDWQTLPETLNQLRKDRECLERTLG